MIHSRFLNRCLAPALLLTLLSVFAVQAAAQVTSDFDPFASDAVLTSITDQLDAAEVEQDFLNASRNQVLDIQAAAGSCSIDAAASRSSIEARYLPLKDVDADVAPAIFDQRTEIKNQLDQAIARETQCNAVYETARVIIIRIAERQSLLSQKFLSSKSKNILTLLHEAPAIVAGWPGAIRDASKPELIEDITLTELLWMLLIGGTIAALAGLTLRLRYGSKLIETAANADSPHIATVIAGPAIHQAPTLLEGLTLFAVLNLTLADSTSDLAIVRLALGIFLYGIGAVLIDWATGPSSPSMRINGLIPDHVRPLRLRLRLVITALIVSFVTLGVGGSAERTPGVDPLMFFAVVMLVAITLLSTLNYLRRIPGLQGRFRLVRYLGSLAVLIGIGGLCLGYQNFAGYLVHSVTMTCLALLMLWAGLWMVLVAAEYLIDNDTPGAARMRLSLGITDQGSRTGAGFLQLVADLFFWISFIVFLIYVWDQSGNTLNKLLEMVMTGGTVGNIRLVPVDVIGGILVFAALLVVLGWVKRWIDRRWLQHIVVDRGARDALITLFGYVGFILALLLGLTQAGVDLGGIAIVSGALAVGIGFGLQAIVNNFVSGLILLFERPIKSGDFVTVGDTEGFIRQIRIRATEIETLDNQNVLVPNSELVSGRVTNWVLRDTHGRLRISVGVAYGSDVELVRQIMEKVAGDHPDVITDGRAPAPRALFMRFGDSSLDFELRVRIQRIERRFTVISDINFALNAAFAEADIRIPFPQRDLHLITLPEHQTETAVAMPAARPTVEEKSAPLAADQITRTHRHELEVKCEPDRMWQTLIDVDQLKRWLIRDGTFLPRIGGSFKFEIRDETIVSGRVDIFLPPRRMRMVLSPQEGEEPLSSGPITIEFFIRERDGRSVLTVTVSGIPATEDWEHYYRSSEDRWENGLKELRSLLLEK